MAQFTCHLSSSPRSKIVLHALSYTLTFATVIGQVTQLSQIILSTQGNTTVLGKLCW